MLNGKPEICARMPAQIFPKFTGTAITGGLFYQPIVYERK
jgi:hypothetical protein